MEYKNLLNVSHFMMLSQSDVKIYQEMLTEKVDTNI